MDNGVDVDPTDSPIFCGEEDKAYEYARPGSGGDGPGLMYALNGGYLERSFCTLPVDATPEDIAEVRKSYPHEYGDPHGGLYFSRLADQNNTAYEAPTGTGFLATHETHCSRFSSEGEWMRSWRR